MMTFKIVIAMTMKNILTSKRKTIPPDRHSFTYEAVVFAPGIFAAL